MKALKINSVGMLVVSKATNIEKVSFKVKLKDTSFLEDGLVIDQFEGGLVISRPDVSTEDYYSIKKNSDDWYCTTLKIDLPFGRFNFSESESSEDELVVYLFPTCKKDGLPCRHNCKCK